VMSAEATRSSGSRSGRRLVLLRHAEVASHRGDQPLTPAGRASAERAGGLLGGKGLGRLRVLSGATRRALETAQGLVEGLTTADPSVPTRSPRVAFALRNPDIYLGGERVEMVSTAEAFAEQVPEMTADDVVRVPFFHAFLTAPDRIGFWLHSAHPPGDDAAGVAERIAAFAASLADSGPRTPDTVVAVTHSPVLRAVALTFAGADPGEPPYLNGYLVDVLGGGTVRATAFDALG
jgi:broad specificity phosphatase PhoE